MNKKIIRTILLSMCSVSVLSAAPALNVLSNPSEVNFSGMWESYTCKGRSLTRMKIVQDNQDYLQLDDGDPAVIGALTTYTTTNSSPRSTNPTSHILSIDWNENKTELTLKNIFVSKKGSEYFGHSLHLHVHYINLSMNKNGQLLLKEKGAGYEDLKLTDQWDGPACVFTKVGEALIQEKNSWTTLTAF